MVAHVCNAGYSGVRDHENCGSKPARANRLRDPISKIWRSGSRGRAPALHMWSPEFKPWSHTHKKAFCASWSSTSWATLPVLLLLVCFSDKNSC
jgi:hypothetical protein